MEVTKSFNGGRQDLVMGLVALVCILWNRVTERKLILFSMVSQPRSLKILVALVNMGTCAAILAALYWILVSLAICVLDRDGP